MQLTIRWSHCRAHTALVGPVVASRAVAGPHDSPPLGAWRGFRPIKRAAILSDVHSKSRSSILAARLSASTGKFQREVCFPTGGLSSREPSGGLSSREPSGGLSCQRSSLEAVLKGAPLTQAVPAPDIRPGDIPARTRRTPFQAKPKTRFGASARRGKAHPPRLPQLRRTLQATPRDMSSWSCFQITMGLSLSIYLSHSKLVGSMGIDWWCSMGRRPTARLSRAGAA
jgi:hypothetical protein